VLFLIEYDRSAGRIVTFARFADTERVEAEERRLALEIGLSQQGVDREVVLLEASTEDALRRTHRRYFENIPELASEGAPRRTDQ
jgi:hypothetical protein